MAVEAWRCVVGGAVDGWGGVEVDVAGGRGGRPGEAVGEAMMMQAWRHVVEEREHGWRRNDSS
jgi:hypothetical protein